MAPGGCHPLFREAVAVRLAVGEAVAGRLAVGRP